MKKFKKGYLFYISAVLYWLAAAINFFGEKNFSLGACFLCLGFTMLLLGKSEVDKQKKDEDENKE